MLPQDEVKNSKPTCPEESNGIAAPVPSVMPNSLLTLDEPSCRSPLNSIAEHVPIGIFRCDASGANVYTNLAWQEISGMTPQQTLGSGWVECIHAEDLARVMELWNRNITAGCEFQMDFRIRRPDGEIRHLKARAQPVTTDQFHDGGCIGYVEDITERRELELERHEHSVILERSLNEIFIFDAETLLFEFVNEGARRNLGYAMSELCHMTPVDIKPTFDLHEFEKSIEPLRNKSKDFLVFQTVHRRANGTDYDVEVRLQLSMMADRPVFLAIILDITERLAKEAEAAKASALQRAIFDHAAYAIIATTPTGIITNFNPAAERLLGYTSEELVNQHSPELFHLESEVVARAKSFGNDLQIDLEPGFDVFVCKTNLGLPNELEWTYVRKDGSQVLVMLGVTALRDDDGKITGYLGIAKDITRQKHYEDQLAAAAVTDSLTGLPNRVLLLDHLRGAIARSKKRGTKFACLFLDFDRFKSVNDSWGHDIGDELLRQIADRLRTESEVNDPSASYYVSVIARLGGDEFVVVLEDIDQAEDSTTFAQRLQQRFAKPYQLGAQQFFSTASIGIVNGPSTYDRGEDILRDADTAMYEAKRAGRAQHVIFDDKMHTQVHRRMQIENELRDAIGTDQFSLHYQPIVSLVTGEITAVEALLRWQHPKFGSISPAEFIPIAHESDMILHLGKWVLSTGCQQCADWRKTLGSVAPRQININLARKQFEDPNLPEDILCVLQETGLPADYLQLEVTEESFAMNVYEAARTMKSIRKSGVTLAIDDFGSGTASFAALNQFTVDVLKVDRSLICNIDDSTGEAALLHGLVVMARNLGMKLVAEGVETFEQLKALQELGCELIQGYYFARPMSVENLECFLRTNLGLQACTTGAMELADGWSQKMTFMVPSSSM
ncbi:sensor domain-containing protein [Novipirellula artificiosorum]|nr:EAL domain-containing protein [Novipirellula artificiosorum]